MYSAALAIPASIPTYTLSYGHSVPLLLLLVLSVGAAVLAHAMWTARRNADSNRGRVVPPVHAPRPCAAQPGEVRALAA